VIVVGNTELKPVNEIIKGIKETLDSPVKTYLPSDIKGKLGGIAAKEEAKVVIALGREALEEALKLPESIAVIYDLVITPPPINRSNTTGVYMATPVKEYVDLVRTYLPSIRQIAVVGSHGLMRILDGVGKPHVASYSVTNSLELVSTVKHLDAADAVLLLPDVALLTASAVEEVYLFSFRKNIPLLGISERHVKQGALLALVFEPVSVGRQLGERASDAIRGIDIGMVPPSPSQKFELYINKDTAKKMNINIPAELLRKANRVYP
jgi:ABC-type uncharacterized transport system substrate-binding protein